MRIGRAAHPVLVLVLATLPMATQFQSLLAPLKTPAAVTAFARGFAQPFLQRPWAQHVTLRAAPRVLAVKMASVSVQPHLQGAFRPGSPAGGMRQGLERLHLELERRGLREEWAHSDGELSDWHEALYAALASQTAVLSGKPLDAASLSQRSSEIRLRVEGSMAEQIAVQGISAPGGASTLQRSHELSKEIAAAACVLGVGISHLSVENNNFVETRHVPANFPDAQAHPLPLFPPAASVALRVHVVASVV